MEYVIVSKNFQNNSRVKQIQNMEKGDLTLNKLLFPKNPLTNELIQKSIKTTEERKNQNRTISLSIKKNLTQKFINADTSSSKIKTTDSQIVDKSFQRNADSFLKNTITTKTKSLKKINKNLFKHIHNNTNLYQYPKNKYFFVYSMNNEKNKFNPFKTIKIPDIRSNLTSRNKSYCLRDNISNIIKHNKNYNLTLIKDEFKNLIPYHEAYNNYMPNKNIYKSMEHNMRKLNYTCYSLTLGKLNPKFTQNFKTQIDNENKKETLPPKIIPNNYKNNDKKQKYLLLTTNQKINKKHNYDVLFNKDNKKIIKIDKGTNIIMKNNYNRNMNIKNNKVFENFNSGNFMCKIFNNILSETSENNDLQTEKKMRKNISINTLLEVNKFKD